MSSKPTFCCKNSKLEVPIQRATLCFGGGLSTGMRENLRFRTLFEIQRTEITKRKILLANSGQPARIELVVIKSSIYDELILQSTISEVEYCSNIKVRFINIQLINLLSEKM